MSRRASAPFKAVLFDAYGTLLRNDDLILVPRQIVADHGLSVRVEEVWRTWSELYHETTQLEPFRTLREIEGADHAARAAAVRDRRRRRAVHRALLQGDDHR
jgi:FMN phosphatase YigB (HAD superfamily)